eukprot:jgi/Botrbrau1/22453/Bobra.0091s0055.1
MCRWTSWMPWLAWLGNAALRELRKEIQAECNTHRYYFKSTRREELPRRFVLHPGVLPAQARLSADLGGIRALSSSLEAAGEAGPASDFADLLLQVDDRIFRAHCCILSARSDYFKALLERSHHFGGAAGARTAGSAPDEARRGRGDLIRLRIGDVAPRVFSVLLDFMYTNRVEGLPPDLLLPQGLAELFDAAERHLVLHMKRAVAEHVIEAWEISPPKTLERLCRVLLAADGFSVALLREHCLRRLAAAFDRVSHPAAPEFERLTFETFVASVAPQDGRDILDGSHVGGASRGNIEGGGLGGAGVGTLLQDLREAYLEADGIGLALRDARAAAFDRRLQEVAQRACLPA